jgi:hypothetical protein
LGPVSAGLRFQNMTDLKPRRAWDLRDAKRCGFMGHRSRVIGSSHLGSIRCSGEGEASLAPYENHEIVGVRLA